LRKNEIKQKFRHFNCVHVTLPHQIFLTYPYGLRETGLDDQSIEVKFLVEGEAVAQIGLFIIVSRPTKRLTQPTTQ
jgi:hypothetical protein